MNAENRFPSAQQSPASSGARFLGLGMDDLGQVRTKIDDLRSVLANLDRIGDATASKTVAKLSGQLNALEASVTMIGQVKAGKTSLVNAMVGWPNLLPADVNPWTSVVTSLHLNPKPYEQGDHASFRFFEEEEWSRLMERGGRVGELASRAGAESELEKVRAQIEEMREKSRRRLGRKFELLLGEHHDYGYFDSDLIERYVCLGDDFEDDIDLDAQQGRFADITKSADLFLHRPEFPIPLCIRDTPGVNDTFMMREQITIRAIRESRICVVVLSAHQALSSVDMALIRLISNVKSREVIIFVNRIDELSDPASQVPEIRDSIRKTLKAHHGPVDAEIVFGSAHWANCTLEGGLAAMSEASAAALLNWAESELSNDSPNGGVEETVWTLSGLPTLFAAIAARVTEGEAHDVINRTARRAVNLAQGVRAKAEFALLGGDVACTLSKAEMTSRIDAIGAGVRAALSASQKKHLDDFYHRLDRSHRNFLERATAALVTHLEAYGDEAVWSYDPTGLRILLRSAYLVFGKNIQQATHAAFEEAAARIVALLSEATGKAADEFTIELPTAPRIAPPVLLGQTIALDLKGRWWNSWWKRRRGYRAYAVEFAEMIGAETDPIVSGLKSSMAETLQADATALIDEFLDDQRAILTSLATAPGDRGEDETGMQENRAILDRSLEALTAYAA